MNPSERRGIGLFHIFLLTVAVFVLVFNMLVDILYALLDPRVRYE